MKRKASDYSRPDHYSRAARASGYPARSVFKLEEIQRRYHILRAGQRVLDLGAAPGSWTLYASQQVGPSGRVLAADLSEISQALPANVRACQVDVLRADQALLGEFAPYDVVLSDMAPATSGNRVRDQALSYELCAGALERADQLGARDSHLVLKLFMSPDLAALKRAITARYGECRVVRPEATRSQSTEVFLVGLRRRMQGPPGQSTVPEK
jgi:23S rRNA (uridine2552-2'-O)-methyltransferase